MKVFLLEDDPVRIGFFLRALYEHTGASDSIHLATDTESALRVFAPPYDLMFLDHDLGGQQMVDSHEYNTGYQFLVRAIDRIAGGVDRVVVHSWNPGGSWAMMGLLLQHGVRASRQSFDPKMFEMLIPVLIHGCRVRDRRRVQSTQAA